MRRKVCISVSDNFFKKMERERMRLQKEAGIRNISQTNMSDLLAKNFPRLKLDNQMKYGKRKKRFSR